jgi:hypothetical protein
LKRENYGISWVKKDAFLFAQASIRYRAAHETRLWFAFVLYFCRQTLGVMDMIALCSSSCCLESLAEEHKEN